MTHNNCLWLIKCSTTLLQAVTGEHECRKVTAMYVAVTRNNCCESLASYSVIFQSDFTPYFKTPVCGAAFSSKFDILQLHHMQTHAEKERKNEKF